MPYSLTAWTRMVHHSAAKQLRPGADTYTCSSSSGSITRRLSNHVTFNPREGGDAEPEFHSAEDFQLATCVDLHWATSGDFQLAVDTESRR